MKHLLLLAAAGGLGALCRYGLGGVVQRMTPGSFPLGTFVVNILGCFLFGLVWGILEDRIALGPQARLVVLTGFMGAFTTFSTFAFESLSLLQSGQWLYAAANMAGQMVAGVFLAFGGLALGRLI